MELVNERKDAEDILQNTFLKIIKNLKNFRKESKISTRAKDSVGLGFRALFAATLACLTTTAVAGVFISAALATIIKF